jgi:hypothetical protein
MDYKTATGIFLGYGATTQHIHYYDFVTKHLKMGNHFVYNEAHFASASRPPGAQLLFDLGLRPLLLETPVPVSKLSFAPQRPFPKLAPAIFPLACYAPLPLLEFLAAPVATTTATLVSTLDVSRSAALTVEFCTDPFGPSFDEPISIQGHHATAGLLLRYDPDCGRCQLLAMQPGTPAHQTHAWKSRLWGAYILCIDVQALTSVVDVTNAIRAARLLLTPNITITFTFDEIVNTLSHAGLPQLYFDQMRVIQNHITQIRQPTIHKVTASPRLTRRKLQQSDAWPEWRAAEHIQLDNYYAQGMFGTHTLPPPNSAIFYWVWVYIVKEMENNHKKA